MFEMLAQSRQLLGARDFHHGKQPFYRDFFRLLKLGSHLHERNVDEMLAQSRQQLGARDFDHGKLQFPRSIVSDSFFTKRTCFDFLTMERSSLRLNNRFHRSIMIWVWIWLA